MFYLTMLLTFIIVIVLENVSQFSADTPLRVMHSILACHLVLHVRVIASEDETNTAAPKSSLVFAKFPVESHRVI
ncbi:hypothetical protein DFH06DRAFT_1234203 [Mycena polygramma]|nr:hypothetical protein DFH06DRAFT_1234203 [Mycena polygramma]